MGTRTAWPLNGKSQECLLALPLGSWATQAEHVPSLSLHVHIYARKTLARVVYADFTHLQTPYVSAIPSNNLYYYFT